MPSPSTPDRLLATTRRLLASAAAVGLVATACGTSDADSPTETPAPTTSVEATSSVEAGIKDFLFVPDTIKVAVGTTVTWTNLDRFGHTVTAGGPGDETGDFDLVLGLTTDADTTGLTGSHTFAEPGTFEFFCRYHPSMVGTVTVT